MRRKWLFLVAALFFLQLSAQEKAPEPQPEQEEKEKEEEVDLTSLAMFLKPSSVVLRVGTMESTWREVQPWFKKYQAQAQQDNQQVDPDDMRNAIREHLLQLATRGLLLQEAKALKLSVTEEDRKQYEGELDLILKRRGQDKAEYMKAFSPVASSLNKLTYEDSLLIIKLDSIKFGSLDLTEQEIQVAKYYLTSINENIEKQNIARKKQVEALRKDPEIITADGFAKLAKTYSEGVEGDNGGELDYDFTRQELADNLDLKSFDWKVGETTPLLETDSCYRIIRVLRDVPPAKEGDPPRIRVAQMLFAKLATESVTDEHIRRKYLPNKKKALLDDYVKTLSGKYPVSSIFFPQGLFRK